MKKIIMGLVLSLFTTFMFTSCLSLLSLLWDDTEISDNNDFVIPETVISLSDYPEFEDNIILVNYSSIIDIDIDFYIYKDSNWVNIGKINKLLSTGKEERLITKYTFWNVNYIGYKSNLPKDKRIALCVQHDDLILNIVESSNYFLGKVTDYNSIGESPSNGIYKFNVAEQMRDINLVSSLKQMNDEDCYPRLMVKNAPKCIIMFKSPDCHDIWDIYAVACGDRIYLNSVMNHWYDDEINEYSPYWIIQVLEDHKYYTISPLAKDDNLVFYFQKN